MTIHISNKQARQLILHLQGLSADPLRSWSATDLYNAIEQLGFVQVDSIQWVERAHHMILFARNQTYRPRDLHLLTERDRLLFENWTHDASFIPTAFFPYWRDKFDRVRTDMSARFERWQGPGYKDKIDAMLDRIQQDGKLMSRDLDRPKGVKPEMWQWHDGKAALEYLWRTGSLCISARESGFQKVYDLIDSGVPEDHRSRTVSHDEFVDWACRSALARLGFGSPGDIARFWDLISPKEAKDWAEDMVADGKGDNTLARVLIEGHAKGEEKEFFARRDIESVISSLPPMPKRMRALSPFDPVIRDRKRLEWLFGFEYRIEIYVPEEKRRWGYYVFPLLQGDRLVGRIDMRAHRKADALEVKRLWWEPGVRQSKAMQERLESELVRQARLSGVRQVIWDEDPPDE